MLIGFIFTLPNSDSFCQGGNVNSAAAVDLKSSNLPIVIVDTPHDVIYDEPKVISKIYIIDNGEGKRNNITDPYTFTGEIGIEIRGSSSQSFPKKQYGVEVVDSAGEDLKVPLLGLPKESDWIFSAPYSDKSLMRNALMYKMSNSIGRYASRSKYFELILDNKYVGVYVLFEKVKRDKNRVNIAKLTEADTAGVDLTGGYIIKVDKEEGSNYGGWYSPFIPFSGSGWRIFYQYDTPKPDNISVQQQDYIQNYIYDFESTMKTSKYADPDSGYSSFIDVDSFIDYILMNEISKNVDGYRLSAFFHKDKDKDDTKSKLIAGPVWDYNLAFGNADYYDASLTDGFYISYLFNSFPHDDYAAPFWWKVLFNDESFHDRLNKRWNELRKNEFSLTTINTYIDSLTTLLDEAKTRNFQKWPVLGTYVWPNYFIGNSYPEGIGYLKNWIKKRVEWLDKQFPASSDGVNDNIVTAGEFNLYQNYPNPFNPTTNFDFVIPSSGLVTLRIYDLTGREIATLLDKEMLHGKYTVSFDASGYSSGIYFAELRYGNMRKATKIMLLK